MPTWVAARPMPSASFISPPMRADLLAQRSSKTSTGARRRGAPDAADLAHVAASAASRARRQLGVELLAASWPLRASSVSGLVGHLAATPLLRVDVDADAPPGRAAPATAPTAAPTSAIARGAVAALTTIWARSGRAGETAARGRARSAEAARAPRRRRPAPARTAAEQNDRISVGTAGSAARARRSSSPARKPSASWRAASAIERAAGASVCTRTRPPRPRPARPASCVTSAKVRSSARKSGKRSVASASSTTPSVDVGEVVALGHHLRADEHAGAARPRTRRACGRRPSRRRGGGPEVAAVRELALAAVRYRCRGARSTTEPQSRQRARHRLAMATVMACQQAVGAVPDERDVAGRALPRAPHERQVRKFDQPRRLSSTMALRASASASWVRGCSGALRLAHVDDLDRRQRRAVDARAAARTRRARARDSGRGVALPATEHRARPARRGARRRGARRSAGRPRACRRRRAPRRRPRGRGRAAARRAKRGPTQTRASPARSRSHSSWRSPADSWSAGRRRCRRSARRSAPRSAASARSRARARSRRALRRASLRRRAGRPRSCPSR